MSAFAHSEPDSAGCRRNFIAVRQKVLIMLWTFYKSTEQVPLLFNKFQIQFINEQLQCWIALYHLGEYLSL